MEHGLLAVSALDGRYRSRVDELAMSLSEAGLIKSRVKVEAAWLLHLAEHPVVGKDIGLSDGSRAVLEKLYNGIDMKAAEQVKAYERTTNHDVKAVEYYMRDAMREAGATDRELAFIHFACTSEDINNLAYSLMLREARDESVLKSMDAIIDSLSEKAREHKALPMLSRTHGQTASPTTLGKELAVFAHRLKKQRNKLAELRFEGKMSGAVGNYNAHLSAYPDVDWLELSRSFMKDKLDIDLNILTTQIENHDGQAEYADTVRRFNVILIGLCRDFWSYISNAYFKQKTVAGEVGSSTMPHKVNPIDFENAEGNLGVANSLCTHFTEKLLISRWQRDLSDSTVQRVWGTMVGHSILAYKSCLKGLSKVEVNAHVLHNDLESAQEVLAEPIQTVMRRYGVMDAYERLKAATRGQAVTREALLDLVASTDELPSEAKDLLSKMTPSSYVGIAERLTEEFLNG